MFTEEVGIAPYTQHSTMLRYFFLDGPHRLDHCPFEWWPQHASMPFEDLIPMAVANAANKPDKGTACAEVRCSDGHVTVLRRLVRQPFLFLGRGSRRGAVERDMGSGRYGDTTGA